jgi:hypothetical protein
MGANKEVRPNGCENLPMIGRHSHAAKLVHPLSQPLRDASISSSRFWNIRTQAEQTSSESGSRDSGEESMSDPLTGRGRDANARMPFEPIAGISACWFDANGRYVEGRHVAPISLGEALDQLALSIDEGAEGESPLAGSFGRNVGPGLLVCPASAPPFVGNATSHGLTTCIFMTSITRESGAFLRRSSRSSESRWRWAAENGKCAPP